MDRTLVRRRLVGVVFTSLVLAFAMGLSGSAFAEWPPDMGPTPNDTFKMPKLLGMDPISFDVPITPDVAAHYEAQQSSRRANSWSSWSYPMDTMSGISMPGKSGFSLPSISSYSPPPRIDVGTMQKFEYDELMGSLVFQPLTGLMATFAAGSIGAQIVALVPLFKYALALEAVRTGRADFTELDIIVPHAVMATKALQGPMNLPTQSFPFESHTALYDGSRLDLTDLTGSTRVNFSSTLGAPFSNWGYDPQTDSITRSTSLSWTQRSFSGISGATSISMPGKSSFSMPMSGFSLPSTLSYYLPSSSYSLPSISSYSVPSISSYSPPPSTLFSISDPISRYSPPSISSYSMPSISSYSMPSISSYSMPSYLPPPSTLFSISDPISRYSPPSISSYSMPSISSYSMPSIGSDW